MVKRVEHRLSSKCPVACSLDVIGDHWTLLIIRNLMFLNLHEYKDMLEMEEGISSNILSDRLKKLEEWELVDSINHPESRRRKLYYLTEKGKGLVYVMLEIVRWADLNLSEYIDIPEEKRPHVDLPIKSVAKQVLNNLDKWEKENLF